MKTSMIAAGLTLAVSITASAGTTSQPSPPTASAPDAPTRHLVEQFLDAYARHDSAALSRTITRDFTARFYETQPVSHITVTAEALARSWQRQLHPVPSAYAVHAPVAVYATPQPRTLFVTYHVAGQTAGSERIALVELRGHRVARVRDFPGSSDKPPLGKADLDVASN